MRKALLFLIPLLICLISIGCGSDSKEISLNEFNEEILPSEEIKKVVIEDREDIFIYTSEKVPYRLKASEIGDIEEFIDHLYSQQENIDITYNANVNNTGLLLWQLFNLLVPILLLTHIILLWIALRKVIKSTAGDLEKILYAMISIFVPFFGPIIYLTTKPKS
ncbi:PLDc N-terminal domain-containing protein [Zunongwangia endophytica]|uniref:PLDc N-terminal domain-containing protein n=1 Tax=Zunongwangia endophytica TaxID=1808945 RepID=A0ABV8H538_9FLAO|nr:PLDc N-terminal domain-containing protein [Zunongwangia endophytica]MDN3595353.1 PLDc N-terminal domain-containing protein [Zunongwangia endophytica]